MQKGEFPMKRFILFALLCAFLLAGCAVQDMPPETWPAAPSGTIQHVEYDYFGLDTLDGMLGNGMLGGHPVIAHATVAMVEEPYSDTNAYTMILHKSTRDELDNFTIWVPQSMFELEIRQEVVLVMQDFSPPPECAEENTVYFFPMSGSWSLFYYDKDEVLQGIFLEELLEDVPESDAHNLNLDTVYDQLIYRMQNPPRPEDLIPEPLEITVEASYEDSFSSVDQLLSLDRIAIVQAKPVSIFLTLDTMVIFNMEVLESNVDGFDQFRLKQARDHYLLIPGQEVVLVLQLPPTSDYCEIPNGGDGLFRENENGVMTGNLLPSLLENVPAAAISPENISLSKVYEMLIDRLP
jgi:hypothetical protein